MTSLVEGLEKASNALLFNVLDNPSLEFYLASLMDALLFIQHDAAHEWGYAAPLLPRR